MKLQICHNSWSKEYNESLYTFLENWYDDTDFISQQTSGSTGNPKVIELKKSAMRQSASLTSRFFDFKEGQTALICLSPDYIAGKMMLVRAFENNLQVVLTKPENPLEYPDEIHIDFAAMVPLQVEKCLNEQPNKTAEIGAIIIGGAAIHSSLEKKLIEHKVNAYATFGMTETTSHIALRHISKNASPYIAIGNTTFSVGSENQLVIHAPDLKIEKLETNDVVELIDSRSFHWKGRKDFVINSGGIKFFPEQIERKIEALNLNRRYFIFSVPDERLGAKIVLCAEGFDEIDLTQLESVLDKYEIPKKVYYCAQFSETSNGKIDRNHTLKSLAIDS